jgi:hypothetical protein
MKKLGLLILFCFAYSVFGMNREVSSPPLIMPVAAMPGHLDPRQAVFIQQMLNNEWINIEAYKKCLQEMGVPNDEIQRELALVKAHNNRAK